ncbi:lipopolysaccharide biosynthesis protein [Adlercreutzia sp. ZJ141]|uniref:lipopolysaccharide biosynthesis protein n=1 Tax=Adlercreutzia sp. ZJ141 TaxID=2709406 RepID=UPI0013EB9E7C|nr:oligosaccharide flippase family protein [Adlercreutzia sp. ZJ141]
MSFASVLQMPNAIKEKVRTLFERGFFHIFGANVINKFLGFFTNVAIVWFLSKDDYGVFGYANSIYSMTLLATGFGLIAGMFQFCLEERGDDERKSLRWYSLTRGLAVDVVITALIIAVGLYVPLPIEEANRYLALFGPLLLLDYVFQYCSTVLRIKLENQRFSTLQLFNAGVYCVFACVGAHTAGIVGTIGGRYVAYAASLVLAFVLLKGSGVAVTRGDKLPLALRVSLWKYSVSTQVSAVLNNLTYLLDVFLVGLFLASASSVASYKVATIIPEGMAFVPGSVIMFVLPYFVKHAHDKVWFQGKVSLLLKVSVVFYLVHSVLLVLLAPVIISVLWGDGYMDALTAFRLLSVSFFFNAMRTTCTNLLCSLRAIASNLFVSALSLVLNVILCVLLIPEYGIVGAAFVPTSVSVVAAVTAFIALRRSISKLEGGVGNGS